MDGMIANTSPSRRKTSRPHTNANGDDECEMPVSRDANSRRSWRSLRRILLRLKINWMTQRISILRVGYTALSLFCFVAWARRWLSSTISNDSSSLSYNGITRQKFPRYVSHIVNERTLEARVERLDPTIEVIHTTRKLNVTKPTKRQESLGRREPFETYECKAQYFWQLKTHPTCNLVYEFDMVDDAVRFLASGFWRDVWTVREGATSTTWILKTLRYKHEFTPVNYERHRRDAMATERLTKSMYVVDLYAYCSNSGMFEYGSGGDIMDAIWPGNNQTSNLTRREKLSIATQAAMGVAALHNVDKEGQASIAHTDISPGQFILINGIYKLNDFNRARFIRWSQSENKPCGYRVGKNPGTNRSPEEYESLEQTEKVDVYSLGNLFYMLLQEEWPFEGVDEKEVKEQVINGVRPSFDEAVWNSPDPVDQSLKAAMMMCHSQSPVDRASARKVESFLKEKLDEFFPGTLASWEARAAGAKLRDKAFGRN